MSENRQPDSRERVVRHSSQAKKAVKPKIEPFGAKDWLEDWDSYRTILHRILQGKGVDHGWL